MKQKWEDIMDYSLMTLLVAAVMIVWYLSKTL